MSPKAKCGLRPAVRKTSVAAGFLEALVLREGFSSVKGFYIQLASQEKKKRIWCELDGLLQMKWSSLETQSSQYSARYIYLVLMI